MRKEAWGLTNEEFTALMRQYQKLIYTVCIQFVHDPHTAEDLTQDTFLAAYAAIDRCEPRFYKQWLVRVAANKCKDYLKSAWVRRVESTDAAPSGEEGRSPPARGDPADPAAGPEDALLARLGAEELAALVQGLRQPYRPVAVGYFLEERSVADLARALGRPQATVQNQLFRAKMLLRQQIQERRLRE
ncbi:MAG: sigma-70 family RNA polymerase sigma factor [Gemmiger sp.]